MRSLVSILTSFTLLWCSHMTAHEQNIKKVLMVCWTSSLEVEKILKNEVLRVRSSLKELWFSGSTLCSISAIRMPGEKTPTWNSTLVCIDTNKKANFSWILGGLPEKYGLVNYTLYTNDHWEFSWDCMDDPDTQTKQKDIKELPLPPQIWKA